MKIKVHMLAFGQPDELRWVDVESPSANVERLLEQVFEMGQNDFQPQEHPSVSVGDVIDLHPVNRQYLVRAAGFKELTLPELTQYRATPRLDRMLSALLE
jgi:hypothetical protein